MILQTEVAECGLACVAMIAAHAGIADRGRPADKWLASVCDWTWRVKMHLTIGAELLVQLREAAEAEAIRIFARNLHELLLAAPAGPKAILGLDPGIRTGCKVAVVDATGKLLDTETIYPHQPRNDWNGALETLVRLIVRHGVELVAIGNGTASRETDRLAGEVIKLVAAKTPEHKLAKIVVSEAGGSSATLFRDPEKDTILGGQGETLLATRSAFCQSVIASTSRERIACRATRASRIAP